MAIPIPDNFDVNAQLLDANESFIRDQLGLDVGNWARFQYAINVGVNADNLHFRSGAVVESVSEAYRELGKSHYEVISSLGSAKLLLDSAIQVGSNDLLIRTLSKALYFHIGCLLDNLARLIYIINDPNSSNAVYTSGQRRGQLIRH